MRTPNPQLQLEVVDAIRKFRAENGYLPSTRDLVKVMNLSQTAIVHRRKQAVKSGLLEYRNRHYIPTN